VEAERACWGVGGAGRAGAAVGRLGGAADPRLLRGMVMVGLGVVLVGEGEIGVERGRGGKHLIMTKASQKPRPRLPRLHEAGF